ncbi:MAG: hypothetical protein OEZ22_02655 [Spirochaetia bacterium]|nr:hypothetical protein [Spirochaetia bacterium]
MKNIFYILSVFMLIVVSIDARKMPTDKEINDDYKKRLKPYIAELKKRKNNFPKGIIIKTSTSICTQKIGEEQNSLSIPANTEVILLNIKNKLRKHRFSDKYDNSPRALRWHVLYEDKIFCIPIKNIKPNETIIIMEGRGQLAEAFARYILFQNGTYIEVLDYLTPFGGGPAMPIFPIIKGKYTRTENTITLCMKEKWAQLSEYKEKKFINKECTVLEKYTNQIPDAENVLEGNWINMKNRLLVIEEFIFE